MFGTFFGKKKQIVLAYKAKSKRFD